MPKCTIPLSLFTSHRGFPHVKSSCENDHKINLIIRENHYKLGTAVPSSSVSSGPLKTRCVYLAMWGYSLPFFEHFLQRLVERVDTIIPICDWSKLMLFLNNSCILLTPPLWLAKRDYIWLVTFNFCLLYVPRHPLVNTLRTKYRCHH